MHLLLQDSKHLAQLARSSLLNRYAASTALTKGFAHAWGLISVRMLTVLRQLAVENAEAGPATASRTLQAAQITDGRHVTDFLCALMTKFRLHAISLSRFEPNFCDDVVVCVGTQG